jgi:hypothetical protein
MFCEIVPQIIKHGYNLIMIASFTEIVDSYQEEFIKAATKLVWSTQYKKKPKYQINGLIKILWITVRTCIKYTDEGLLIFPNLEKVKENIEKDCELQTYGYVIPDKEVNERFEKFWLWLQ